MTVDPQVPCSPGGRANTRARPALHAGPLTSASTSAGRGRHAAPAKSHETRRMSPVRHGQIGGGPPSHRGDDSGARFPQGFAALAGQRRSHPRPGWAQSRGGSSGWSSSGNRSLTRTGVAPLRVVIAVEPTPAGA